MGYLFWAAYSLNVTKHRFGNFSGYLFVTSNSLSYLVIANYYITSASYAALDNETFSNSNRILIKTKCILINFGGT